MFARGIRSLLAERETVDLNYRRSMSSQRACERWLVNGIISLAKHILVMCRKNKFINSFIICPFVVRKTIADDKWELKQSGSSDDWSKKKLSGCRRFVIAINLQPADQTTAVDDWPALRCQRRQLGEKSFLIDEILLPVDMSVNKTSVQHKPFPFLLPPSQLQMTQISLVHCNWNETLRFWYSTRIQDRMRRESDGHVAHINNHRTRRFKDAWKVFSLNYP